MRALLAFLLLSLSAYAQQFAGQSGGTVRVVPPYRFCLGADNGTDACFIQNGLNTANLVGNFNVTGSLTCAGGACAGAGVTLGTAGQVPVMNSGATAYAPQSKPMIDVRDFGVTCGGTVDDTTAFQSAVTAACNTGAPGKALILPNSCKIKLTSNVSVAKCAGMSIDSASPQGQASIGSAELLWYGSAGGTVLTLNQVRDSTFGHLTVDTEASNHGAVGATTAILDDEIAPVTSITTNNHFNNIQIYNPFANASFIGIDICPTAPGNCEAQNFDRLLLSCSSSTPTSSSAGTGLLLAGGQPNYMYVHWVEANFCSTAINAGGQEVEINGGLMGQNYNDFTTSGVAIIYRNMESQLSNSPVILAGAPGDVTIDHNIFNGMPNGTTTIAYSGSAGGARITISHNTWTANNTITPFGPISGGTFNGTLISENNTYPGTICPVVTTANAWMTMGDQCNSGENPFSNGRFQIGGGQGIANNPGGQFVSWHNGFHSVPQTVANTFTCAAGFEGSTQAITDSTTAVWGATITGGGGNHVLAYCDGTNLTVLGK